MTRKSQIKRLQRRLLRSKVPPEHRGDPAYDPDAPPMQPGELEAKFETHIRYRMGRTGEEHATAKAGLLAEYKRELDNTPSGLDML